MKVLATVAGAVMLVSAFALSLAFFAVLLVVVLIGGGYLWWRTRELRRQVREQMNAVTRPQPSRGATIEGEVLSRDELSRERR